MSKKEFLMCPPDFFDIEYSINPWMNTQKKATNTKTQQWVALRDKFTEIGAEVKLMKPQKGLPDMVYIDAGVIYNNVFVPSNFRHKERQGERKFFTKWFEENGYKIEEVDEVFFFEGHGDTLWSGSKLFCGYGIRSSAEAHHEISKIIKKLGGKDIEFLPIELIDQRFYHLDTCFCPLDDSRAFFFPNAFSEKGKRMLEKNIELIPVDEDEAIKFACNSVVVGKNIIIPSGTHKICKKLEDIGYKTHQVEMGEFMKGGGACKCLSMPLE